MTSFIYGALYTASAAATTYGAKKAYHAVSTYYSSENYEDKYLKSANEAQASLKEHILTIFPKVPGLQDKVDKESTSFSGMKNVLQFIKDLGLAHDETLVSRFETAVKIYEDNLEKFQAYSPHTTEENLKSVKQAIKDKSVDASKLSARESHFESSLILEGLAKTETTEEGASARVLRTKEALQLSLQMAFPTENVTLDKIDEYLSRLDTESPPENLANLIKSQKESYTNACKKQDEVLSGWMSSQKECSNVLLSKAKLNPDAATNLAQKGKVEYLERRVSTIENHVYRHFTTCFDNYKGKIKAALKSIEGRLEEIDPGQVEKSRSGSSGWNVLKWIRNIISSAWNQKEVASLQSNRTVLLVELHKKLPGTEKAYVEWNRACPFLLTNTKLQLELDRIKKDYTKTAAQYAKGGDSVENMTAGKQTLLNNRFEELSNTFCLREGQIVKEYKPEGLHAKGKAFDRHFDLYIGKDLAQGDIFVKTAMGDDFDKDGSSRAEFNRLKDLVPELKDAEELLVIYEDDGLHIRTENLNLYIGKERALGNFKLDILTKLYCDASMEGIIGIESIRNKLFPENPSAFIKWEDGRSEVFYDKPQVGKPPLNGVLEGGNKDFEHSKFVIRESIKYSSKDKDGIITFHGDDMRLGLSMADFSKPLAGLEDGFLKSAIESLLSRAYRDGAKMTLNLKALSVEEDTRDGRVKVKGEYELNTTDQIELERGSELNTILRSQLAKGLTIYIDQDEFKATFENTEWS
ncbi:MAG: hypothetical protein HRU43_02780 [Simkaniaceae bacterium]|nr:hypothetical protein [Simkaniaceae bacterium]